MVIKDTCYGCEKLQEKPDAAGGGVFTCLLIPGLVLGEWGHWCGIDHPVKVCTN